MEERRKRIRLFVALVTLATTLAFSPTLWALIVDGELPKPVREELRG
jgi:predicted DNA-binding transcriptional regulator AlpA